MSCCREAVGRMAGEPSCTGFVNGVCVIVSLVGIMRSVSCRYCVHCVIACCTICSYCCLDVIGVLLRWALTYDWCWLSLMVQKTCVLCG